MFFKQFPKIDYDFNRTGVVQKMVDLYRSVRPLPSFLDEYSGYKFYDIKNGERPDIVSGRLYGTPRYYWTFFLVNDHLHDGYRAWPMSQESLQDYMIKEYNGFAIETKPKVISGPDGEFENSLSGRFTLGETVIGGTSNASGTVTKKIADLSQLIVQDTTGTFTAPELIVGQTSTNSVSSNRVYKYIDAPYYFYKAGDALKKPVTSADHITGGVNHSQLEFVSNRAYLEDKNDSNSRIRYVDPAYINKFTKSFKDLINR
tara:strand:- start:670 stop:1446 length:777 start_codon:yes stop_codon:yes gene_type:complete